MASRRETYPRRFHSGLPSAKRYRAENPAAKTQKNRRPQRIGGQPQSRHFVRFEGDTLVVRERLLSSGVPNPKLPIVHELAFGASRRPYRVTVFGNRVIVFGSYPEIRSFIIDTTGQLSESRGFSIGATVSVVRGDYVAFAIAPPMPSRHNPHDVLRPLPTVQVFDGPITSTTVSLVNGREARGQRQGGLVVVGHCSFTSVNPKRACTASTNLIPGVSYQLSFGLGDTAALLDMGTSIYTLPWNGSPATLVPAAQSKPANARALGNGWLETKGQTVTLHLPDGSTHAQPFSGKISDTVSLGQHALVATKNSDNFVLTTYHVGKGFTPIAALAIPNRVLRDMQFHPTAPQSGYVIAQSTDMSGRDLQFLIFRVEKLNLSLIHNSHIPPMPVSILHGELIIALGNTLVRL